MTNGMTRAELDALNAVRDMNRKMKDHREIDWEQRRYEVARECQKVWMRFLWESPIEGYIGEESAKRAIECADALIAELKKGEE